MDNTDTDPASITGTAAEAVASLVPSDMLDAAAGLADPGVLVAATPWLASELADIALGRSDLWFDERDKRFADPAWRAYPYRLLGQTYRLYELWMDRMSDSVDGSWQRQARARWMADMLTAAASPANFLATNPVALRQAFQTRGRSVLRGIQNFAGDLARGGMPRGADRKPFVVGKQVACTPGAVVYRDEMFELLQYSPGTQKVRAVPLLMVPPQVNRYYILDLAPGRSLVEFAVSQGIQTFMIVWRNPRADLGHGRWGLDDYVAAQERAAEVVRTITHSEKVNWLGLCAGGMTLAFMLGHQAATSDESAASATYLVTMLSGREPNAVGMLDTGQSRAQLALAARAEQVVPGTALRTLFAFLRPNDLVYSYLVNGWLMGQSPTPFDVLAWNDDASSTPARFALETTELVMDGWEGDGPVLLGTPTDLGKVGCDSFHVAGYTDHITRWRACYSTTQVLGGDKELTVVKSGHIQSFVNPIQTGRYDCWYGPPTSPDPDKWMSTATVQQGSWWQRWAEWLTARSGGQRPARAALGSRKYPPLGTAPGTYAHE
jgi:polyhydroxyalkanoate synthase subunit PhaC